MVVEFEEPSYGGDPFAVEVEYDQPTYVGDAVVEVEYEIPSYGGDVVVEYDEPAYGGDIMIEIENEEPCYEGDAVVEIEYEEPYYKGNKCYEGDVDYDQKVAVYEEPFVSPRSKSEGACHCGSCFWSILMVSALAICATGGLMAFRMIVYM